MKVAVLSANLGAFEREAESVPQAFDGELTFHRFTDENCPPRTNMSPRLQARILKCYGWEWVPGFDTYVWVDGQFRLGTPDAISWLLQTMGPADDLVAFAHPDRHSVHEEAAYLRERLPHSNRLMQRYTGEWLDRQMAAIDRERGFPDTNLWATGILAYRLTPRVQDMFERWWHYISRYHVNDQLSFPLAVWETNCRVQTIHWHIFTNQRFVWTRGRYHA